MATAYQPLKINGVISTDKTALQNLNDLCTAAGAFLTYDISQGKWAVVINKTETSVKSYNDSNIIGSINVSETGVSELYNTCSIEFPHKSLRDETDFVEVSIPAEQRYPNEITNTLNIQSNLINDPVQAQYIASIELKQSRLNKIITFTTDYTSLGLKAGDIISVTTAMYGYSNKLFRVIKLEEIDEDIIGLNITALEYDPNIYSTAGLIATEKTKKTGILLRQSNPEIQAAEDANIAGSIGRMIAANAALGIANNLLNKLFGRKQAVDSNGNPIFDANGNPVYTNKTKPADASAEDIDKVLSNAKRPALSTITAPNYVCEGQTITITVGHTCSSCLFNIPDFDYPYTITGVSAGDIDVPLTGNITVSGGTGTLVITTNADGASEGSETLVFTCDAVGKNIVIWDAADYTLTVTKDKPAITEGESVVITVTGTGSKANGVLPYTITGSAASKVTTPLTGDITVSGGTGTLTIATQDDGVYQGSQGITITVGTATGSPCASGQASTSVSVLDNDSPPAADTTCVYVSVPAVWCGQFDGTTGALKGITVRESVMLPVPQAGEASIFVPYACSVSGGSIVVDEEIEVAAASVNCGGFPVRIITSFNAVPAKGIITGSTVTLYGYTN